MNIKKLNYLLQECLKESLHKPLKKNYNRSLKEYWNEYGRNETSAPITLELYDKEWDAKTLKLVSSTKNLSKLLNKLDELNIRYYFYTNIDESPFEAASLDELQSDIDDYYSDIFSSVDTNLSQTNIEIDDDEVIVGSIDLVVWDDEEEEEEEYQDDEDDEYDEY